MNTREAAEFVGLEKYQVRYLMQKGIISPSSEYEQGKEYHFDYKALVRLSLAVKLLNDGYRVKAIKQALATLDEAWIGDDWREAGALVVLRDNVFAWQRVPVYFSVSGETMSSWKKAFYQVDDIAREVWSRLVDNNGVHNNGVHNNGVLA